MKVLIIFLEKKHNPNEIINPVTARKEKAELNIFFSLPDPFAFT